MKTKILGLVVGFLLIGFNLFAADGDLIVNGKVGMGTTNPAYPVDIYNTGNAINFWITSNGNNSSLTLNNSGTGGGQWNINSTNNNADAGGNKLTIDNATGGPYFTIQNGGNVGIGTTNPVQNFTVQGDSGRQYLAYLYNSNNVAGNEHGLLIQAGAASTDMALRITNRAAKNDMMQVMGNGNVAFGINAGNVGIGTSSPSYPLHMGSGAHVTIGGVWTDASSVEYKENIKDLTTEDAIETLERLNPVRFNYKMDKEDRHVGFIAEDVPEIIATKDRKGLSPMDIVAVLTKVVQEQWRTISELSEKVDSLQKEMNKVK